MMIDMQRYLQGSGCSVQYLSPDCLRLEEQCALCWKVWEHSEQEAHSPGGAESGYAQCVLFGLSSHPQLNGGTKQCEIQAIAVDGRYPFSYIDRVVVVLLWQAEHDALTLGKGHRADRRLWRSSNVSLNSWYCAMVLQSMLRDKLCCNGATIEDNLCHTRNTGSVFRRIRSSLARSW